MKHLKHINEISSSSDSYEFPEEMEVEFREWVGGKLGITLGLNFDSGILYETYQIDKFRAITITQGNVQIERYLENKNIEGFLKIYQTGKLIAPNRFIDTERAQWSNGYRGISFLQPDLRSSKNDYSMYYFIHEIYDNNTELAKELENLNHYLWFGRKGKPGFAAGDWIDEPIEGKEPGSYNSVKSVYVLNPNDYHPITVKTIQENAPKGFGAFLLQNLYWESTNKYFMRDLRKFLAKNHPETLEVIDRLILIFKNLKKLGFKKVSINAHEFMYNSKGDIVITNIFEHEKYNRDTQKSIPSKAGKIYKDLEIHNLVGENNFYDVKKFNDFSKD